MDAIVGIFANLQVACSGYGFFSSLLVLLPI